jgi:purine nucleosidase
VNKIPILLDTDPGSDIDDAIAISYLLKKKECDLLGITTVTGPVDERAAIAEILCHAAGRRDIPIHCGRSEVLLYGPGQPACPHYAAIAGRAHRKGRKPNEAVDFLRNTIRSRPGEIVLLSIGPLTNIALLFAIDPEIPSLLKEFVSMGGVVLQPAATEWNCACDPLATAIVAKAERKRHFWIGLDVTRQCQLSQAECQARFKGPLLNFVLEMTGEWFKHTDRITFHDPLAAATIFNPGMCTFEQGLVAVNPGNGETKFTAGEGNDLVATKVDSQAFFEEYFSIVTG